MLRCSSWPRPVTWQRYGSQFPVGLIVMDNRWRRKQRTHDKAVGQFDRLLAQFRCEIDQVVFADALPVNGRRLSGEGLRRPGFLARNGRLRYGTLLDGPYRFAGHPIEHI